MHNNQRVGYTRPSRAAAWPVHRDAAWLLAIAFAVAWLMPSRAASQSAAAVAPGAATDPIVRVNVDLAARAFDRVLPFDVPFFIAGTPPGETETLQVQFREVSNRGTELGKWQPAQTLEWRAIGPITADTRFAVLLRTPLEAERFYEFRFLFRRGPDAEFKKLFDPIARSVLDTRLWTLPRAALSPEDALALRKQIVDRIRERTKERAADWEPRPASLFDLTNTSSTAATTFIDEANQVLKRQDDRIAVLQTFAAVQPRLSNAVRIVHANADLRTFVSVAQKLTSAPMQELLKVDAEGLGLLSRSAEEIQVQALGGSDVALSDVRSAEDMHARVVSYQDLHRRLTQLRHFIRTATDQQGLGPEVEKAVGSTAFSGAVALAGPDGALQIAIAEAFRAANDGERLESNLRERETALVALVNRVTVLLLDERFVEGTTVPDASTAQNNYISADGGLLYAGDLGAAALYVGTNFYLRPVNKDAPLSQVSSFARRFAFTVGLTVSSVADEGSRRRADLFANQSLILGAGYRVTPSIRAGGGVLIYRKANDNPLVSDKKPWPTWYGSFSFDIDVARGLQGGLGGKFPQQ
jgi:hypothetical protein